MSVYNAEIFVAEAVESILAQTFQDFEFIIIDDGSTDKTPEILAEYAQRDARIRLHRHDNRGRTASLNVGIGLARGTYIARMDADDIALVKRLEEQADFLEKHAEVGLLSGAFEIFGPGCHVIRTVHLPLEDSAIKAQMLSSNPICHPAVIMRKDVVDSAGGYREAFKEAEDYDLWLRMAEYTQFANLDQVVLRYRVHPNQASVSSSTHQVECVLAARAAASLRRRGALDPLWRVECITPKLLRSLGVTAEDVRQAELSACIHWIDLLADVDADSTLPLVERVAVLCKSAPGGQPTAANALMQAAGQHFRRGHLPQALACTGRSMLLRPEIAGRHLKMAIVRRVRGFTAWSSNLERHRRGREENHERE